MYSAEEIDRRAPVWHALSELFLDTELDQSDLGVIAEKIRAAGFSADQAEEVLCREVAPVFWTNLLQVAGEWEPWSEQQVRELVCNRLQPRSWVTGWFHDLKSRRQMAVVRSEWLGVRECLERNPV